MTTIPRHDIGDPQITRGHRDDARRVVSALLGRVAEPYDATVLMEGLAEVAACELALGAAPESVAREVAQAAAFATAAALAARHPAAVVWVGDKPMPGGDADMHAWRWWQALALACVGGAPAWRGWLARADVIAACQSPPGRADAVWPAACLTFAAAVTGGDAPGLAAAALRLAAAATITDPAFVALLLRPRLEAFAACTGDGSARAAALAAALAAHRRYWGERPLYDSPDGFVAWDLAALGKAAGVSSPYVDDVPVVTAAAPAVRVEFPPVEAADAVEAHWLMDRAGPPRAGRSQRSTWRDGTLYAEYEVAESAAAPALRFSFAIVGATRPPMKLHAFDPGEAMAIADGFSRRVPALPPADAAARRTARADLVEALAAVERVIAALPDGAERMPAEAFRSAEGQAVCDAEPGRFRRERLEAVRGAWRALLAEYDAPPENPLAELALNTRVLALAGTMAERARPVLELVVRDPAGFLATVRPRPGDAALAFVPEAAAAAGVAYEALWREMRAPRPEAGESELLIVASPAGLLDADNMVSAAFPTGYRAIAHLLQKHRIWLRWQHVRPGAADGLALDGLVWLDDHWAWFPRPYRVLK